MRVACLPKIKKQRIFREFVWPSELLPFARYNIIYGWNGSGKTTLSGLFGNLQDKRAISDGEVEFQFHDGTKISGTDIPSASITPVRVFNRHFVAKTIEAIDMSNVAPIYFLGAESIAQQKKVEALKTDLSVAREDEKKAKSAEIEAENALDEYFVDKAKFIKEALLGSTHHANYDKRRFKDAITLLKSKSPHPAALSEKEKERLRKKKELQAKSSISKVAISIPATKSLLPNIFELLDRSIISKIIDELASNSEVGNWVQRGLAIHTGKHESGICQFCGNEFSAKRRDELEAHFNDDFATFQKDIDRAIGELEDQSRALRNVELPDESRFYDHLADEARTSLKATRDASKELDKIFDTISSLLKKKRENPFEKVIVKESELDIKATTDAVTSAIEAVNSVIDKHENTTLNLNSESTQACKVLEQGYVLEFLPKFEILERTAAEAEKKFSTAKEKPAKLEKQIAAIENEIIEHRRPAEELNHELHAYLGRDELQFEVKDSGYSLSRSGKPAQDLSEGERTAIAFLYFLKSLEDKGFERSKGIVVIDDPVSSLDANSLFSAFGYMKERTKDCYQLFILTHNFAFFRQVKNWFHHIKGQKKKDITKRPARFYTLVATYTGGERCAVLTPIDPLLEEFESEYHFLFRQVHDVASSSEVDAELEHYYGVPNIARRLLETFLAYRFPDCSGDLFKRFDRVTFDSAKKTRILRLLNTYSHTGGISDPEHDPSVLAETKEVMKMILELISAVDGEHYDGMMKLIQPVDESEE